MNHCHYSINPLDRFLNSCCFDDDILFSPLQILCCTDGRTKCQEKGFFFFGSGEETSLSVSNYLIYDKTKHSFVNGQIDN